MLGDAMLPGRELIEEIERTLYGLEADEWELSEKLEEFILEKGDFFLSEWRDIRRNFTDRSTREQVDLILDVIQSEAYEESEKLRARADFLDQIDDELEKLIGGDEEEDLEQ
jgi:hypothetical protein